MATWYVDPEGGNDSNNGSSFALRCKSFSAINGTTGAAAGDTIRIMASHPQVNMGNATWTDNTSTVVLASALTVTIDNCDAAWTPGANTTCTVDTTRRKQGTGDVAINCTGASQVANQLLAYKALGSTMDLSAYQCVSLWFQTGGSLIQSGGSFVVCLCSDSAGAVPVATLQMDTYYSNNSSTLMIPALFENGGANLPSNVNSIAIYAGATKPFTGSASIYIDNVIACKKVDDPAHLSHQCIVSKQSATEVEWYAVGAIDGTSITLASYNDNGTNGPSPARKYRGTTETITSYARLPTRCRMNSTTETPKGTGTPTAPISWTGGWDRTSMSSQTDVTWLGGMGYQGTIWNNSSGNNGHIFPDGTIGFCCYLTAGMAMSNQFYRQINVIGFVNGPVAMTSSGAQGITDIKIDHITQMVSTALGTGFLAGIGNTRLRARIRRITMGAASALASGDQMDDALHDLVVGMIDNNSSGVTGSSEGCTIVRGCTFQNNIADVVTSSSNSAYQIKLVRPVFVSGSPALNLATGGADVKMTAVNGNRADNRRYLSSSYRTMSTTTVHGSAAQSVQMVVQAFGIMIGVTGDVSPGDRFRIGRYAVKSGHTLTVKVWVQRSDVTNTGVGISTLQGSVAGVTDQLVSGSATANTWEQLTITATPTEDGVIEVWGNYWTLPSATSAINNVATAYFSDTSASST
jgi:hypothetical protein